MGIVGRSVVVASLIELPLLLVLAALLLWANPESIALLVLIWYHVVPLSAVTFAWYALFDHGSPQYGPLWAWNGLYWVLIFAGQAAVTTPVVLCVLGYGSRRLGGRHDT